MLERNASFRDATRHRMGCIGYHQRNWSECDRARGGDEVFSRPDIARRGTYAEYVAVDAYLVVKKQLY